MGKTPPLVVFDTTADNWYNTYVLFTAPPLSYHRSLSTYSPLRLFIPLALGLNLLQYPPSILAECFVHVTGLVA